MEQVKTFGIGRIIAIVVLILSILLVILGKLDNLTAGMFAALALAILL